MSHQRTSNSISTSGSDRSRFFVLFDQSNPNNPASRQNKFFRLSKDLFKFALLTAFFFAILSLFNYGLSQLNRVENLQNNIPPTSSSPGILPPPTVFPSGHAEVKMPGSPRTKPTAEIKKKDNKKVMSQ